MVGWLQFLANTDGPWSFYDAQAIQFQNITWTYLRHVLESSGKSVSQSVSPETGQMQSRDSLDRVHQLNTRNAISENLKRNEKELKRT